MPNISHNLAQIQARLHQCAARFTDGQAVPILLAVSKTKPVSAIIEAYQAGQRDFGENYAQELTDKALQLQHLAITWHFIGPIQSNKTHLIAEHCDWVHSIDRAKIAERLNAQRPAHLPPLQVCIQVNVDQQTTKSGVDDAQLPALIALIKGLPHLRLRGLMTIPDPNNPKPAFLRLAQLAQQFELSTLSMGMSDDMDDAIAAGSTMVRIGSAIFGQREHTVTIDK
ncbi:MAG: YggS family pyridoxal phosphate-dependent enzyme [Marinagarivorans sp.]|nr:YggS family pyridoxal phosphate-dependent enzyme [Marinagarivorans sp.]